METTSTMTGRVHIPRPGGDIRRGVASATAATTAALTTHLGQPTVVIGVGPMRSGKTCLKNTVTSHFLKYGGYGRRFASATGAATAAFHATSAFAQKQVSIGSVSNGNQGTTLLTTLFQKWVTFATGPWAVAVIAISIAIGIAIWVFMPREGFMGWVVRGLIGGLIMLNLATYMSDLGFSGGGVGG